MIADALRKFQMDREALAQWGTEFADVTVRMGDAFVAELSNHRLCFNDPDTRNKNLALFDKMHDRFLVLLPRQDMDDDTKRQIFHKLSQLKHIRDGW